MISSRKFINIVEFVTILDIFIILRWLAFETIGLFLQIVRYKLIQVIEIVLKYRSKLVIRESKIYKNLI